MQFKFEIENCKFLKKIVLFSSLRLYSQLYSNLRLQTHVVFLLISVKFAAVLRKIFFPKTQFGGQNGGRVVKRLLPITTVLKLDCCYGK